MSKNRALRMGYLVSKYPAVSHTFILREVAALRERGIEIETASINESSDRRAMTGPELDEAHRTFYVKQAGFSGVLKGLTYAMFHHPIRIFSGFKTVLRLGGMDPKRTLLCSFYLAEAFILALWLRKRSLNHLHVHFASPAATVALLLTKIAPVSFSIMVHGPDEFYDVSSYYLTEKIASAEFVLCISNFAQSQLMRLSPSSQWTKFDIARLGVDTNHFSARPARISPETFEILCVARLVATKGQAILIQAVTLLLQQGRKITLRLIGDGPERVALEQMIQRSGFRSNIRLEGAINQDHIQAFYRQADIFALASFAEGIPVVLMEAMAMEIPCVATGINGIPELIQDGKNGILVPPSDVEGLADAFRQLMDDPGLRQRLAKAGRASVLSRYEININVDHLASIFLHRLGRSD